MQSTLIGDYLSAFKGTGLEFEQIREYYFGDDVRHIDWNSSAKSSKIMIKQFVEERDRTIILAIDISSSNQYSSGKELRKDTIDEVASFLTLIATHNKDKVGALFFSDKVEKWIPPGRGKVHCGKIIETIFTIKPKNIKTSIEQALRFLISLKNRNSILFMLSDWIDETDSYTKLLKIARCKYDFISIRFLDKVEKNMPKFGLLEIANSETGQTVVVDTRKINTALHAEQIKQKNLFKKYKIDFLDLTIARPYVNQMVQFFHQRIRRQIQ
jgi:uncharacterized protein (DUF58 family)